MTGFYGRMFNRIALVVGAASGIGRAAALLLAREGATIIAADRDAEGVSAVAAEINAAGGQASWLRLDVTSEDDWAAVVERIAADEGRLHVLVASAGVAAGRPLASMSLAEWRRVMAVNLDGAFLGIRQVLPLMRQSGGGSIVLVGSASGTKASAGAGAYCASKAGLAMLARVAALEAAPDGIRVNTVSPGGVKTPLWNQADWWAAHVEKAGGEAAAWDALSAQVPLKRFAEPDEVAQLILYLASDDSAFVTGSDFPIDGGFTAS